jgi:CDP-paratose 2-epimerase
MKQVLITGGAGFVGVNVAKHYLTEGHKVVVFDNFSRSGCTENRSWLKTSENAENLIIIQGDIRWPPDLLAAAVESSDALFHFAAQVAVTTSVTDPRHDFEVNAQGTFNLLELVRNSRGKKPAIFYASTNKVYGSLADVKIREVPSGYSFEDYPNGISEEHPIDFHSPYGCSKGAADQYVLDYARIYNLRTVVFRQSCIYGYRQFGIEDQGWVAWFVIAAVLGKPLTIFGNGKQVRDVLFIDDLVQAFDLAWKNIDRVSGEAYNIGGGAENAISLQEVVSYLRKKVNPALALRYSDWRPGDQPTYISDIRKAKAQLSWLPQVAWTDGINRLVEWVVAHREVINYTLSLNGDGTSRVIHPPLFGWSDQITQSPHTV